MRKQNERLTKKERLRLPSDIWQIRKRGRCLSGKAVQLIRLKTTYSHPRLAIAFTVKTGPSALRNQARRKIREFFRKNKRTLGSFDYFFFSSRALKNMAPNDWQRFFKSISNWVG